MKSLLFLTLIAYAPLQAGFTWAEVQVEGLTCSMCAKSVEIKVRDLDFVQDVRMDLVATTMRVEFKKHSHANMESLAEAVDDAGFSVGYLNAAFVFDEVKIQEGRCVRLDDRLYSFVRTGVRTLDGETVLKFVGEAYLPKAELAGWKPLLTSTCGDGEIPNSFVTIP